MAAAVAVVVLVLAVLLAGGLVWSAAERVWDRRLAVRRRVLVNLLDGSAVEGVLWSRGRRLLVLRDATLLEPGREKVSLDGEVLIERHQIAFVQAIFATIPAASSARGGGPAGEASEVGE